MYDHLEPAQRNHRIASDIYDKYLAGLTVQDFRDIMSDLQARVNRRSIIPPHERQQ